MNTNKDYNGKRSSSTVLNISLALLLGASFLAAQQTPQAAARTSTLEFCKSSGGEIVYRQAVYGTNASASNWLVLAPIQGFCEYTSAKDGSTVGVFLETLTTTQPTLAALSYYSQTKPSLTPNGENPASHYCTQLGGTDVFGGIGFAGGGWVNTSVQTQVRQTCVFPDSSAIDSFGLFYHSAGIINGIDLSTVLRYQAPATK